MLQFKVEKLDRCSGLFPVLKKLAVWDNFGVIVVKSNSGPGSPTLNGVKVTSASNSSIFSLSSLSSFLVLFDDIELRRILDEIEFNRELDFLCDFLIGVLEDTLGELYTLEDDRESLVGIS
ncbi:hypothetical protein WICMUC_005293 [Wickerhamomyces mucosus]|uniref:Uncharacterized protein n=1 Tax=Wickerhamomyces mucosus TaxID=1378264 RepID=A0A9P8T7A6_9ASCO|nr:hypothetical protein WICMUC_005293 [Wickerhamomyces mucosus]